MRGSLSQVAVLAGIRVAVQQRLAQQLGEVVKARRAITLKAAV